MQVEEVNPQFGQPQTQTPVDDKTPKDEFLRLLVAQLQNQDPLEPQSGAEFVAQLAQFAQIEVGMETNARLESLEANQAAMSRTGMAALVGQQVWAQADEIRIDKPGAAPDLSVDVTGPANSVEVIIYDDDGNEVRRLDLGPTSGGRVDVGWDGTDAKGVPVEEGGYRVEVLASGKDGASVDATASIYGLVEALEFIDGEMFFRIGDALISPSDIESVRAP
jgi:flagellar basal-body rod modification protein FlgD